MDQETDLENWARLNGYWHDDPHAYYKECSYKFYGYGLPLERIFAVHTLKFISCGTLSVDYRIDTESASGGTLPVNVARISRKTATFPAALTQNRPLRALRQSTW